MTLQEARAALQAAQQLTYDLRAALRRAERDVARFRNVVSELEEYADATGFQGEVGYVDGVRVGWPNVGEAGPRD